MNTIISIEKRKEEIYVRLHIKNHEMLGPEANIISIIGPSMVESNRVIFDFSEVHNASSSLLDAIVKISKKDKKNHASFVFSNHLLKIVSLCGLHKIIKIID